MTGEIKPPYYTNDLGHQVAGSPATTAAAHQKQDSERTKATYAERLRRRAIGHEQATRKAMSRDQGRGM